MRNLFVVVISGLALSACHSASLNPTDGSVQSANLLGDARDFSRFAGGRDLHTEIHGNPFAMPDREFAANVTGILNARNAQAPTNFTTKPGPSADPAYRAVLVFNGAGPIDGHGLCAATGPVPTADRTGGRIPIALAFCEGATQLHGVNGTLPPSASPADPQFQNALGVALALAQPHAEAGLEE